jgi:WhiB family transcriptional regulator, redox-sensing transcriptional regulator
MTLLDSTSGPPLGRPPHTHPPHTHPPHTEEEVPEMTLTALLDAGAIGAAAGEDVPCQQEDPELWFAEAPDDVEFAKALCGTCPVQQACLAGAQQRREPWGVWGGQLFIAGVVVPRKRPRGRPRKVEAPLASAGVLQTSSAS